MLMRGVPVVGSAVNDDIDAFVRHRLAEIGIGALGLEFLCFFSGAISVDVADGHDVAELARQTRVDCPHPATSDEQNARSLVRRFWFFSSCLRRSLFKEPAGK